MSEHGTGWEDAGMALVTSCGNVAVEFIVTAPGADYIDSDDPTRCPNCGKFVRLVWDVRVEVVEP